MTGCRSSRLRSPMAEPLPSDTEARREPPAFNVPGPVGLLLVLIVGVFLAMSLLPPETVEQAILLFALFAARYSPQALSLYGELPGGFGAELWTPVTYTFLHSGWEQLIANGVWLLAFGTPVARRFGASRFFIFYFAC